MIKKLAKIRKKVATLASLAGFFVRKLDRWTLAITTEKGPELLIRVNADGEIWFDDTLYRSYRDLSEDLQQYKKVLDES